MRKEEFEFIYSEDADLQSLMKDVQNCENDVWFETLEGDRFSLKSTFCQVIMLSLSEHPEVLCGATVRGMGDEHNLRIRKGTRWGRGNGCSFFWNCSTVITNYVIGNTMQSIT